MPAHPTGLREDLRAELDGLVVRRTRVALWIGLTTVAAFAAGNHLRSSPDIPWTDVRNGLTALVIGVAFAVLKLPAVQRRPVPFALIIFAFGVPRSSAGRYRPSPSPCRPGTRTSTFRSRCGDVRAEAGDP